MTDEEFYALERKIHIAIMELLKDQREYRKETGHDYVIPNPLNFSLDWGKSK